MAYTGTTFSTPKLDGQALRRVTSKQIKENIFQDILALPEKGVTEQFSNDTNASEIRIIRQNIPSIDARQLGGSVNGGYFNSASALMPSSTEYGVKVLYMIDNSIDYPTVMDEMVELPVAEATNKGVAGVVSRNINASTLAHQLVAVINKFVADSGDTNINRVAVTSNAVKDAILEASAKLDDGDSTNGVDIFPVDGRQCFLRASARPYLMKTGEIIIGGSNYAQEMLKAGVIAPDTYKDNGLAYIGEVDGIPVSIVSKVIWNLAETWAGATTGDFDDIVGLVVAGIATARVLAFNDSVKIIDSPAGMGKRAQYKYRWGLEVLHIKGIVPLYNSTLNWTTKFTAAYTIVAPASQS